LKRNITPVQEPTIKQAEAIRPAEPVQENVDPLYEIQQILEITTPKADDFQPVQQPAVEPLQQANLEPAPSVNVQSTPEPVAPVAPTPPQPAPVVQDEIDLQLQEI